jgi:hypothetical protein
VENRFEQDDQCKVEFYNKCKELRTYAQEFFSGMIEKYGFFLNPDILPIIFYPSCKDYQQLETNIIFSGECTLSGMQSQINIYNTFPLKIQELKQNIRHEVLHYLLIMSNLKCKDDTAVFHVFCNMYDAHAYTELPTEEKVLLEKYDVAFQYIDTLQSIYKKNKDKNPNLSKQTFIKIKRNLVLELGLKDQEQQKTLNFLYETAIKE